MTARSPSTPAVPRRVPILHPFVLAVFPSVSLAAGNRGQILLADFLVPVAISLLATVVALVVVRVVVRAVARDRLGTWYRSALAVSFGLVLFMVYGHVFDALQASPLADTSLLRHRYGLAVSVGLLALGVWRLSGASRDLRALTVVANVAALTALAAAAFSFLTYERHAERAATDALASLAAAGFPLAPLAAPGVARAPMAGERRPNVYYIVLDGYASGVVLERYFDHDASPFEADLRVRGFDVVTDARSNYPITFLSLASSLNMTYLDDLAAALPTATTARRAPYRMVANSTALAALRAIGYRTINIDSGWGPTKRMASVDRGIRCGWVSDLSRALIQSTMLRAVSNRLLVDDGRRRLRCAFESLASLPTTEAGPFVVVSHILAPHPPYLFNADGARDGAYGDDLKTWRPAHRYVAQLRWVNDQLRTTLDRIIDADPTAVVVLHGDHGPATRGRSLEPPLDALLRNAALIDERTGILLAMRLSPGCPTAAPGSTPVNAFRRVFACGFGANLPLLDDRVYFASYARPYQFHDVTDRLRRPASPQRAGPSD